MSIHGQHPLQLSNSSDTPCFGSPPVPVQPEGREALVSFSASAEQARVCVGGICPVVICEQHQILQSQEASSQDLDHFGLTNFINIAWPHGLDMSRTCHTWPSRVRRCPHTEGPLSSWTTHSIGRLCHREPWGSIFKELAGEHLNGEVDVRKTSTYFDRYGPQNAPEAAKRGSISDRTIGPDSPGEPQPG